MNEGSRKARKATIGQPTAGWGRVQASMVLLLAASWLVVVRVIAADGKPGTNDNWNFGPATNGLQAAVEFTEGQEFIGGQAVPLRFHFRNASKETIQIFTDERRLDDDDGLIIANEAGGSREVHKTPCLLGYPFVPPQRIVLKPGEETVVDALVVVFKVSPDDLAKANDLCGYWVTATPGDYTVRFRLSLKSLNLPAVDNSPDEAQDWHGTVDTGLVKIKVKAR